MDSKRTPDGCNLQPKGVPGSFLHGLVQRLALTSSRESRAGMSFQFHAQCRHAGVLKSTAVGKLTPGPL